MKCVKIPYYKKNVLFCSHRNGIVIYKALSIKLHVTNKSNLFLTVNYVYIVELLCNADVVTRMSKSHFGQNIKLNFKNFVIL